MIGILGGTFDPVHIGHLRVSLDIMEDVGLSEVRLVPCRQPPHRPAPVASTEQRLQMLELAVEGQAGMVVDTRELGRDGRSYSVDTLASLRGESGDTPLCLLVGSDAFLGLNTWHRWRELTDFAHLVVMRRPDNPRAPATELADWLETRQAPDHAALHRQPAGLVHFHQVTQLEISASRIRSLVQSGRSIRYLVPDRVKEWIERQGIYGEK